jgi:hypothetical protein
MNTPILYILGNGFDLAHHLPTSYEDFHNWLVANGDAPFVDAFEKLYPNIIREGKWSDIESALGSVKLEEALTFAINYQECNDEINGENSSHDSNQCGERLKHVIDVLPSCLHDWAHSIKEAKCVKTFDLSRDDYYLSFNFTRILENFYQIPSDKVLHIHGAVESSEQLVMGYGDDSYDEDECDIDDEDQIKEIIIYYLRKNKKPVNTILKEKIVEGFLNDLSSVSSVIVYGHSYSDVDRPYFKTVANYIKNDARWCFYVHDKDKNDSVEKYANSVVVEEQTFVITNKSPIKMV